MEEGEIKLSVIVPVYNTEQYLRRCLDSLVVQDFSSEDYEILVVNDGSTDGSLNILHEYAEKYSNIHIFTQTNAGVSAARNKGIDEAKGRFICFVDSDDAIVPNGLSYVYNRFVKDSVDMIRFFVKFETEGDVVSPPTPPLKSSVIFEGEGWNYLYKYGCETFSVGFLYRRSFIKKGNLYFGDYKWSEDLLFVTLFLLLNPRIISVSFNLYRYYIRPNSATTTHSEDHSRRCVEDGMLVNELLMKKVDSLEDDLLCAVVQECLSRRMATVFSRAFYANYSLKEFRHLITRAKKIGLLPMRCQTSSVSSVIYMYTINMLYYIPILYKPIAFFYKTVFARYILPSLSRE